MKSQCCLYRDASGVAALGVIASKVPNLEKESIEHLK